MKTKTQKAKLKKAAVDRRSTAKQEMGRVVMERVALSRIREAAYNPRKRLRPGDAEWEELVGSVRAFGYVDPLVWNKRTGNLVGGHQRLGVMRHLAPTLKSIDVSVVDVDLVKEKALNLALNKVKGKWDEVALPALLEELAKSPELEALGGMAVTGFSAEEVDALTKEGERLVELLVPGEGNEEKRKKGNEGQETREEEEEEAKGKKAGRLTRFNLMVQCGNREKQRRLYERLTEEGFACELRSS